MWQVVIIMAACALSNVICFLIGAKTGMSAAKGEPIEMPAVKHDSKHVAASQNEEDFRVAELEQRQLEVILRNIENYDGTPYGQEDVPRE